MRLTYLRRNKRIKKHLNISGFLLETKIRKTKLSLIIRTNNKEEKKRKEKKKIVVETPKEECIT